MTEKVPFSTQISGPLRDALTATVRGLREGVDPTATLSAFTDAALAAAIRGAEEAHHNGRPWPTGEPLPPGKPSVRGDSAESAGRGAW